MAYQLFLLQGYREKMLNLHWYHIQAHHFIWASVLLQRIKPTSFSQCLSLLNLRIQNLVHLRVICLPGLTWTLAKRTQNSTQANASCRRAFDLRSTCVSFDHPLALTSMVELKFYSPRTQVDASYSAFGHLRQVDTSWSQVNCICVKFATCVNLRVDMWIRLATHRKSVHKFCFCKLASTYESVWLGFAPNNSIHAIYLELSKHDGLQLPFARTQMECLVLYIILRRS